MTVSAPSWQSLDTLVPRVRRVIESAQDIVCLAHKDADADSLGSALAFAHSLRAMGKSPHPVVPDPVPLLLEYLPGFDTLESTPEAVDAVFTFDCATLDRFGEKRVLVEGAPAVVNVDHHVSNQGYGDINLIQPEASASGQVAYHLMRALGMPIDATVATNLYAALLTDTGGFRHENTTEAALRLGAELVSLGANPGWVALKSYKSRAVEQLRLEAFVLSEVRTEVAGTLIWGEVTQSMLERAGADMQHSEGCIDQLQSLDTMKLAILFKEMAPDLTKISVRSRDEIDATDICRPFGGGGHRRAAGAELEKSLAEAEPVVLELARRHLQGE